MPDSTSATCADVFLQEWVSRFGLPSHASSDNGPQFVAAVWKDLQAALGTVVTYSPPLHPQSLGALERQHKDLKQGLKATLLHMGTQYKDRWCEALPWTLLGKRTSFQADLGASPAELVFGEVPRVPGDLVEPKDGPAIPELLEKLRALAAREPIQTAHHRKMPVYWPHEAEKAKLVFVKIGKPSLLGPMYEGPYVITKKLGDSCLEIRVGSWNDGTPRHDIVHWNNCVPYFGDLAPAERAKRGRKPLNPKAKPFKP